MAHRIQEVVSVIFALAFVSLLAMMNGNVIVIGQNVNRQLNRTSVAAESYELQAFNDTNVTGATVISAIKNFDALTNYELCIEVTTKNSGAAITTTYGAGGTYRQYSPAAQPSNTRITPTKSFHATIAENINGVLTAIEFTEN